jgi:hypothetical protein
VSDIADSRDAYASKKLVRLSVTSYQRYQILSTFFTRLYLIPGPSHCLRLWINIGLLCYQELSISPYSVTWGTLEKRYKQAGAEVSQAQFKLRLAN